jgi:hypothetical protein
MVVLKEMINKCSDMRNKVIDFIIDYVSHLTNDGETELTIGEGNGDLSDKYASFKYECGDLYLVDKDGNDKSIDDLSMDDYFNILLFFEDLLLN